MTEEKPKIQKFTDLEAWKQAHELATAVYKVTKQFPKDEIFGITNQMRRAAVSVSSNIAEGFSRNTPKDKSQFYTIAKGSITELENQILLSRDIGYLPEADYVEVDQKIDRTGRLITGLLKFTRGLSVVLFFLSLSFSYIPYSFPHIPHTIPHIPSAQAATIGAANVSGLSAGLVGYWPLDGATTNWLTGITRDLSGQGRNGSMIGMSTTTSPVGGKIGQALKFPGVTGNSIGNFSSSVAPSGASHTECMWFNTSSTAREGLFGTRGSTGGGHVLNLNSGAVGRITYFHTGGTSIQVSGLVSTGKWYHICAMLDAVAQQTSVYLNGVLVLGPAAVSAEVATTFNGVIGDEDFSLGDPFKGSLDDVRIYNRALSASEVKQLYTQGTATVAHSSNVSLSSGLIGYWPFDGNTTNWNTKISSDISGTNNNATISLQSTTTSPVGGKIAQALYFNGTAGNYASIGSNLPITTTGTLSAWVKIPVLPPSGRGGIISDRQGGTGVNIDISNEASCTHGVVEILEAGGTATCGSVVLALNKWYLVTVVLSGTTRQIYINGALDTTTSGAWTWPTIGSAAIGSGNGAASAFYTGAIDDVRIYNRVLLPSEVKQLYTNGGGTIAQSNPAITGSGLVGYWTFDGPKINWATGAVSDSSGQGNTGALIAMSTSSSPVAGKVGQALKFNGVNSYTSATISLAALTASGCAWIKSSNVATTQRVFALGANTEAAGNNFSMQITGSTIRGIVGNTGGGQFVGTAISISSNVWYHTCMVFGGGALKLYVNGNLVANDATATTLNTVASTFNIGTRKDFLSEFFTGTIDDVRVYNRALSAAEVTQLYNSSR